MLSRSMTRSMQLTRLAGFVRPAYTPYFAALQTTPLGLTSTARLFRVSAPPFQRAADVYSSPSSSASHGTSESSSSGSAHQPPPPPPAGRLTIDRRRSGAADEQSARYLRNIYLLSWLILVAVLLDWWNSSVAAGGALLTAHEIRTLFSELIHLIQREDTLLRAEVVALNENTKRSRDELKQELAEARRDMLAVLLNEGRLGGGGVGKQLNRLLSSGGSRGSGNDDTDGGWLSSLAEKSGLRSGGGGGGGRGWDRGDRSGEGDLGAWDAGFMSGLRAQLANLAGGDSGEKAAGQPQPVVMGEAPAEDDRYKQAMAPQWSEGRRDNKRDGK